MTASMPSMPLQVPTEPFIDGDASAHLEELINGTLPSVDVVPELGTGVDVELVGPHLRLSGTIGLGRFRRLSDLVNHHDGLIGLRNATILRRNGTATRVTAPTIWVSPAEVTLIGELSGGTPPEAPPEFRIRKDPLDLADRRIIARYTFALLNRRHIVATTVLAPEMARGRTVL